MSASAKCHHPSLSFDVGGMIAEDRAGRVYARMRVTCPDCDARFRFIGVSTDIDPDAPTIKPSGFEVVMPLIEVKA